MQLEFMSLSVRNFGSFTEEQTFNFGELEIGAYFIRGKNRTNPKLGSNGSGKSTFFINALCWVLTGRTPAGLRSTDIKPWSPPKGKRDNKTTVALDFAIDGKKHTLSRTAPNAIELDGGEVSQEHVDKLLRISSLPILKQTVLFGQREPLFFDLSNKDKLAVLSEVLELDKWEVRAQKASERVRSLERKVDNLGTEIKTKQNELDYTKALIKSAIEASKSWKVERADSIAKLKKQRAELRDEKEKLEKESDTAVRIAKAAAENLGSEQAEYQIQLERLRKIETDYAKAYEQRRMIQRQIDKLDEELKELGEADACPTCGQPITGTELGKHKRELKAERKKLVKEIEAIDADKFKKIIESHKERLSTIKSRISTRQAEYDQRRSELDKHKHRLAVISTLRSSYSEQIANLQKGKNPHIEHVKQLKARVQELTDDIEAGQSELDNQRQKLERAKFWVKGFKDVRLFIIEDVLQELELTTNSTLAELGLPDWEVKYAIERETKTGSIQTGLMITILSPTNTKPVRWELWSGGEGQRLRLAGSMALSEVLLNYAGVCIDLEVFDEPTKHMNEGGVDDFCEFLANRASDLKRRIFLIDHTAIESSAFVDTVTVVKDTRGSRIE